ncbi:MAG: hypothetical protein ABI593_13420 [Betaproteobacteria bacterium]
MMARERDGGNPLAAAHPLRLHRRPNIDVEVKHDRGVVFRVDRLPSRQIRAIRGDERSPTGVVIVEIVEIPARPNPGASEATPLTDPDSRSTIAQAKAPRRWVATSSPQSMPRAKCVVTTIGR